MHLSQFYSFLVGTLPQSDGQIECIVQSWLWGFLVFNVKNSQRNCLLEVLLVPLSSWPLESIWNSSDETKLITYSLKVLSKLGKC